MEASANGHSVCSRETKLSELPPDVRELCQASLDIRAKAYAPYSKFLVGAALRAQNGEIITGCNVENISYGLSICAERSACVKAVSEVCKHLPLYMYGVRDHPFSTYAQFRTFLLPPYAK